MEEKKLTLEATEFAAEEESLLTISSKYDSWKKTVCRTCGSKNLRPVFKMGEIAISDFPDRPDSQELSSPLDLYLCSDCTLVQLGHTVPQDLLFRTFWYRSGVTQSMKESLADIVRGAKDHLSDEVLHRFRHDVRSFVLDIGANDGTLLSMYQEENVYKVGFEPATNLTDPSLPNSMWIQDYFNVEAIPIKFQQEFFIITAIAMFYDLDDPNRFLSHINRCIKKDGVFVIQMNYLPAMLELNAVDNICHEHLTYYTLFSLQKLLNRHALYVYDAELNAVNGGSIRVYCGPKSSWRPSEQVHEILEQEENGGFLTANGIEKAFENFEARLCSVGARLAKYLESQSGKKIYICGASTRGNTTLQYLFYRAQDIFIGAGERDEKKWERFTVATHIPIVSEQEARANADIMVVLPWHFKKEITEREQEFLARGGELIFPLPELEIVRANVVEKEVL